MTEDFSQFIVAFCVYLLMIVSQFDTSQGIYEFQFEGLETELHRHPAIEVLFDASGSMQFSNGHTFQDHVSMLVIDANVLHQVVAPHSNVQVFMIEHRAMHVKQVLSSLGFTLREGVFVSYRDDHPSQAHFHDLKVALGGIESMTAYDERVQKVLHYLQHHEVSYEGMLSELTDLVHLSASRLSHLFKENMGISLKKYLLWCKLRNTIAEHLDQEEDLFASLIKSGFYDQPHFSRAFKTMLGVNPTKAYNSRTIQL